MPRKSKANMDKRSQARNRWDSVLGIVSKVHAHDGTEERFSNHEVNVEMRNRDESFKLVPIHTDYNGSIYVPQKGDVVELGFIKSGSQSPFVANVIYTENNRAPLGRAGHDRTEYTNKSGDNLYLEAEPVDHSAGDPGVVRFAVKGDGLSDPIARIELDNSGNSPQIRLTRGPDETGGTDMGLELNFDTGEFTLGDGSGYGITSDGSGNFKWYHNTIDMISDGSTIQW